MIFVFENYLWVIRKFLRYFLPTVNFGTFSLFTEIRGFCSLLYFRVIRSRSEKVQLIVFIGLEARRGDFDWSRRTFFDPERIAVSQR